MVDQSTKANVSNTSPVQQQELLKPVAGEHAMFMAQENVQYVPQFDPASAELSIENGALIFNFSDGSSITLEGFSELPVTPSIVMPDGSVVAGDVIVAQLMATDDVFSLETAAGAGAAGGGGHNYSDDLGDVIDLLNGVPPLPPTFLQFTTFEAEDFEGDDPTGGDFVPGTFTAYGEGVSGGYEDWQPDQHVGDNTPYPMQVHIAFTPDDNEVVDQITLSDIPNGVRLFVGDQANGFTEVTLLNGEWTTTPAALGSQGIFMLPTGDTDGDIPFHVSLLVRDPDTGRTITLDKDVTAVIDAVADQPDLAGTITVGAVTDAAYVSGNEGDTISFNLGIQFGDMDGSETHTITMEGIPQEWTLLSDGGMGFGTAVDNGDGTVTYTVTYTGADFNGVVSFNPNEWTSLNGVPQTGEITVTARAVETAVTDGEITYDNNESEVSTTFRVNLSEDVPEIILVSGPAVLAEPDLLVPGADIDSDTIVVDFHSDGQGTLALTTDGLNALNLTSNGEDLSYTVSPDGQVITATDEGGNTVFTVTIDPNSSVNGTEQTFTYHFELQQPLDHANPNAADNIDIPVQFIATDTDGDTADGTLHLTVVDDVPVVSNSTVSVDESDDLGLVATGDIHADLGADGYGSVVGNGSFSSSDTTLTADGHTVTVSYANGVYTGTANGQPVFTLTLAQDGTYSFVQHAALDHDDTSNPDDVLHLYFGATATDYDGDHASATITVNIDDDGPAVEASAVTLDETTDIGVPATGSVYADYGVDGAGSLTGNGSYSVTGSSAGGSTLMSGGEAVTVSYANGVYTGTANGQPVFTLTVQGNGQYSFVQQAPLDHADGSNPNDVISLHFGVKVTDGDGDSVTDFITVNVKDDAPVANDDHVKINESDMTVSGNVVDGSGSVDPSAAADDVGQDVDGSVTHVMHNGVAYDFATYGQTDANGTYVEVNGEHGTLKMYDDGDYSYTLTGPIGTATTQHVDFGVSSASSASEMQAAWNGAELYAFDFGTSWENGGGALDLSLADDTVSYTDRGIGVTGGEDYLTVPEQINHDPRTGESQALAVNLGFEGNDAVVKVSNQYLDEAQGEWGQWYAYDANGNMVDSGTFSDNNIDYGSSNNIGSFTVHASSEYQYLVFSALPYGGTADSADVDTDSSDYYIRSISFETQSGGECETDEFSYRLADYDTDTDDANLTICIKDDVLFIPVDVEKTVDETFVTETVSDTIHVEGAIAFALGTLAGDDGFTSDGSELNGNLTSHGVPIDVTQNGNVITGMAGGVEVFNLTLESDGDYTFNLTGHLDHADAANPNDIINLNFVYNAENNLGETVEGNITIHVKDDAPVAYDDHNMMSGVVADGNVITGENGGPGAEDAVGQDTEGFLTEVTFGTQVHSFASEGHSDANGTYVEVNGDYGVLKIYEDGEYTYTLTNPPTSTVTTTHTFDIDPSDIIGQPTSITEDGITISVGQAPGNAYLNYGTYPEGEGLGISSSASSGKVYSTNSTSSVETVKVELADAASHVDITFQDIGPNNAGAEMDFYVTYQRADGSTYSQWEHQNLPQPSPVDFTAVMSLDANNGDNIIGFEIGAYDVANDCDSGARVSFLVSQIDTVTQTIIEETCVDQFDYTLSDHDGDLSSALLTFCIEDTGEAPTVTVEGNSAHVTASFFNMEDDAIPFPMLEEREDIKDLATDSDIDHMVDTAESLDINFPTEMTITYVESDHFVAGYDNAFGVYIMGDDGSIINPELLWGSMSSNDTNPLEDGTQFIYKIPEGVEGTAGFFIIKDGFELMESLGAVDANGQPTGNGELKFVANGSGGYDLYYVEGSAETLITTSVFHSLNQVSINPDGYTHAIAGLTESGAQDVAMVGFEDLYGSGSSGSDRDFNDVMFTVTVNPIGDVRLVTGALLSNFDIADVDSTQMSEVKIDVTDILAHDTVSFNFDGSDYSLAGDSLMHAGVDTGINASIVKDASGIHVLLTGAGDVADFEAAVSSLQFETSADPMSSLGERHVAIDVIDDFGNTSSVSTTYSVEAPIAGNHIFVADTVGESITGTAGQDMFVGLHGDETFHGEQGNDMFFTGSGNDTVTGGQGADHFVFLHGESGADTITDYSAADHDTLNIADLLGDSSYVAGTSDVHDFVKIDANTGDVMVDTSGAGSFDSGSVIAHLDGVASISTVNIILNDDEGSVSVTPIA